ncbi:LytR/AlgR family response regulator transcription factor [Elizabethkingia anophelis]|uniref:LytR/AlgR family response regulator transcription factor n=1 Tax=Elizabethkingia anophelis TaxID=1117645 RepID=UPI0021A82B28|nr:response regulator transcription factor [Elizabethkingia anophelis]MCT4024819.1 response regulator transcription factor [Elizabethkingia anophelis]MCT4056908.1 response regulator transcription factor [Elizabethkingia anophelis]MCT4089258.1 response regulator transcription factor [Elizabethkingia anophelis]MCT4106661.1 response regulator transcription factor [Elizabethkingia anophelis]
MINCIIVDDEPLAIKLLENHISKIENLCIVGTARNAMEAYRLLQEQTVDLMFLDIQMPDLDGIAFLKSLSQRPKTIFTTAYREFALEGFELEAVDYILKPVTFERFFRSVERVLRNDQKEEVAEFIILKSEGLQRKVILADIVYLESQGNDVKVFLKDKTKFMTKATMAEMEIYLSAKGFLRVHRSFMINTEYVTAFGYDEVVLGIQSVPVGRSYKKAFDNFIQNFFSKGLRG